MKEYSDDEIIRKLSARDFKCQLCSRCCRKEPGIVVLTEADFELARKDLEMTEEEFLEKCCREVYRDGEVYIGLKEKKNYDCILWSNGCIIYESRPIQCRTFPYWPYLVEDDDAWFYEQNRCPGINKAGDFTLEYKLDSYKKERDAVYKKWPGAV